jgi:2-alkyl-3-oxoalkanoate reductase
LSTAPRISVVTGAAGFVGQALVRRLVHEGDRVRALVLGGDPLRAELRDLCSDEERLTIIEGDVADLSSIIAAFRGVDRVFHAAALVHAWAPRARFWTVNVLGTQNVARACLQNGVRRLVAVSTSDVFGMPDGDRVLDEASPFREWREPYADSKIAAVRWLWQFTRDTGLPVSVIYPGWVYGPGDRAFFPGLAAAIRDGMMFFWGRDVRLAWVYIENLVDACVLASAQPHAAGEGYLIFDTLEGPTMEKVCARIAATVGARLPTLHLPYPLALGAASMLQSIWRLARAKHPPPLLTVDVKAFGYQWRFSNEKARQRLGWTPHVSLETGMQRALDDLADRLGRTARAAPGPA